MPNTKTHTHTPNAKCQNTHAIDKVVEARGVAVDFDKLRHGRRLQDHHDSVGRVIKRERRLKKESTYDFLEGLHPVASKNIDDIIDLC